jgi:phosphomannomutase
LHREEKAQLVKNKAILEQQVELLTIQLHEASERERNLKKTYSSMIKALQQQNQEGEEKIRVLKK